MNIYDLCRLSVGEAEVFFRELELAPQERLISERIRKEITDRLKFLLDVGMDYLSLERSAGSLSGGESQRIRLATQIGSGLMGVLYILDEPTIGLHPRDTERLIRTLKRLRDLGNTVIVVEHDAEVMKASDQIVDMGPGAGEEGGEVVFKGHRRRSCVTLPPLRGNISRGRGGSIRPQSGDPRGNGPS